MRAMFLAVAVLGIGAIGVKAEEKMPGVQRMIGAGFEIEGVIPEMRSVLVGLGQPIIYRAEVDPVRSYVVVLGSFEAEFGRPGIRVMDGRIEGAEPRKIDVIDSVGWKKPYITSIEGKDQDGDGWLDITVAPHADGTHPAPQITVMWIFDQEDWAKNKMTAEQVMKGEFSDYIHHYLDCGSDASFYPELTYEKRLAPIRDMTEGLVASAKKHAEIKTEFGDDLTVCRKTLTKLEQQFSKKQFDVFAKDFNAYAVKLGGIRDKVAAKLAERYKPHWERPAETRMASPWSAEIHIRQEDNLRLKIGMLPRPTSDAHKFHPQYATRVPFDWIEVATTASARRESTALGLDYDLGLQDFQYDPLVSRYTYRDGQVSVQVMDRAAVRVAGERLGLEASINVPDLQVDGPLVWRKMTSVHDAAIYAGIVFNGLEGKKLTAAFESGRYGCKGFTVLWADSLDELKALGAHLAGWGASQKQADRWIEEKMDATKLTGKPKLAERVEIDKRTLLSMVHQFGGIYASLDGGYNAIWVRDTTIVALFSALSGEPEYLRQWAPYLIENPTPLEHEGRVYQSFIIAPYDGEHIFKEEDDGPFYAIVSAYAYWKLLEDDSQLEKWYVTLADSMAFLEAHSYKPEVGLYAEYLINEAPLKGSPYWKDEQVETMKIEGDWPMYIQSVYLNNLMYASNLMMGEIAKKLGRPEESERYFERADSLAQKINELLWREDLGVYLAGLATMEDGRILDVSWSYYNIMIDYPWAHGLFPITPDSRRSLLSIDDNVQKTTANDMTGLYFSAAYGHCASIYSWSARYDKAVKLLEFMADYCMQDAWSDDLKALYAMKGAMPEVTHTVKFHRPQTFAAAPIMHGVVSLGASVDFNGINVVPSGFMDKVEGVQFKNGVYDIDLTPVGTIGGVIVNGKAVPGSLKLPSSLHAEGRHKVSLLKGEKGPLLMHTPLELLKVEGATYTIVGYGRGTLRFTGVEGMKPNVTDADGQPVEFKQWADDTGTYLQVQANGKAHHVVWE